MQNTKLVLAKEVGFAGERIVGISEVVTDVSVNDVCTTSLDIAEFHTMVRKGKTMKMYLFTNYKLICP